MSNDVTVNGFSLPQDMVDEEFAKALAVARAAGVKVVSRLDRNNPLYFDKRTHQPVGGIELNRRMARL